MARPRKNSHEELHFEEIALDRWARDFDVLELPLPRTAFRLVSLALLVLALIMFGRAVTLGVFYGDFYAERASANANRVIVEPAPRGIIFDRYGLPLVENVPTFSVAVKPSKLFRMSEGERQAVLGALERILGLKEGQGLERLEVADVEVSDRVVLLEDVDLERMLLVRNEGLPGVLIEDGFRRHYLLGESAAHLLGYTGFASKDDIARDPGLHANDLIGKTGIEEYYDRLLRGRDGTVMMLRTATGEVLEEREGRAVEAGSSLHLTIDAEFQEFFSRRLAEGLRALGRTSGAGLAIDPQNGEILALMSLPSFDNNAFVEAERSDERAALLTASEKPLFNRAVSGLYNPASAIKPLHALAALAENVVAPETSVFSAGAIEIPNPFDPTRPSRFADWKAHGWVNVHSALARSSNVYFYAAGGGYEDVRGLGISRLREWWQKVLLGRPLGIDLPGEAAGFLPEPEEKEERTGEIWRIGDTYNVSIGQGDLLLTPLQLLASVAAVANGGQLLRPHLALEPGAGDALADLSAYAAELKEVEQGMRDAVREPYGTAHLLHELPFGVAAKTGSAQVANNQKTNALFVGYSLDKQIAVLVLVEDAREGSLNAVPIARDVLAWYYEHRIIK